MCVRYRSGCYDPFGADKFSLRVSQMLFPYKTGDRDSPVVLTGSRYRRRRRLHGFDIFTQKSISCPASFRSALSARHKVTYTQKRAHTHTHNRVKERRHLRPPKLPSSMTSFLPFCVTFLSVPLLNTSNHSKIPPPHSSVLRTQLFSMEYHSHNTRRRLHSSVLFRDCVSWALVVQKNGGRRDEMERKGGLIFFLKERNKK